MANETNAELSLDDKNELSLEALAERITALELNNYWIYKRLNDLELTVNGPREKASLTNLIINLSNDLKKLEERLREIEDRLNILESRLKEDDDEEDN
jgi:hypothetical protein